MRLLEAICVKANVKIRIQNIQENTTSVVIVTALNTSASGSLSTLVTGRHSSPRGRELVFGSLNIRSLTGKLDDLLELRRDRRIDVLFLVETWHDSDSVCLRRLRAYGFQVVDRPRPRERDDTLATNYGGVIVIAVPGVRLTLLELGVH